MPGQHHARERQLRVELESRPLGRNRPLVVTRVILHQPVRLVHHAVQRVLLDRFLSMTARFVMAAVLGERNPVPLMGKEWYNFAGRVVAQIVGAAGAPGPSS